MKFFKPIISGVVLALIGSAATTSHANSFANLTKPVNMKEAMLRLSPDAGAFDSQRVKKINEFNAKIAKSNPCKAQSNAEAASDELLPDYTLGPIRGFYDIDGPDGKLWYCTAELISNAIEHQYYTEYVLTEYIYKIYDSDFNYVGQVHDKMRYKSDEVRVPGPDEGIGILPVITKNYFNSDDKYELVVSIAVNTTTPGINHYRSVIYSIDGEKEVVTIERDGKQVEIEVDKPVSQFNSFVSDVLDGSTNDEENFYMTFMSEYGNYVDLDFDKLYDGDEEEGKKYWDAISNNGYRFTTYGKADANGKLVKVFDYSVSYQTMQGDQESSPFMMTFTRDNKAYILCPRYKETFFNPYYSPFEDMTMRENNTLVIDLYKLSGYDVNLVSTTEVPVTKMKGSNVLATYYSVGDLRYAKDVDFDANGNPIYVVTRCNYTTTTDETSGFCFYVYDSKGNKKYTIFENSESNLDLCDVKGHSDQALFVIYDEDEGYVYNMVDLATGYGKNTVKINYLLDTGYDEPEVLGFNVDRVPIGDSYKYAFEMRAPLVDEDDNDYIRIAWFNADGSFDRIDHVNMGKSVNYAQAYISGTVLAPEFVHSDAEHEYMILIKRGISGLTSQSQEELIVAQPADQDLYGGRNLLHLKPCEKGSLSLVGIYPGSTDDDSRLMVGYSDGENYTADFYDLPFDLSGIEEITIGNVGSAITFDGLTVSAEGFIKVYNAAGRLVATGNGSVAVDGLASGVYVAVAGQSVGKILVK